MGVPTDVNEAASKTALLDAAARLLAQRPPTKIPGRTLAAEAGVNYGMVHYFGGRDQIVAEAYDTLVRRFVSDATTFGATVADVRQIVARDDVWRAAANLAMDAAWSARYRSSSRPIVEAFERLVAANRPDADVAERAARVASALSMLLGWAMFAPLLAREAGLDAAGTEGAIDRLQSRVEDVIGARPRSDP